MKFISINRVCFFFLIFINLELKTFAQTTKTDRVLESGKLLLDFFKIIQPNKPENKEANNNALIKNEIIANTICFYNPLDMRVSIEISQKSDITKSLCNATIPSKDSICCYNISKGLYHIKINEAGNKINLLKEYDILIDEIVSKTLKILIN